MYGINMRVPIRKKGQCSRGHMRGWTFRELPQNKNRIVNINLRPGKHTYFRTTHTQDLLAPVAKEETDVQWDFLFTRILCYRNSCCTHHMLYSVCLWGASKYARKWYFVAHPYGITHE
jgi:hypothetical protein